MPNQTPNLETVESFVPGARVHPPASRSRGDYCVWVRTEDGDWQQRYRQDAPKGEGGYTWHDGDRLTSAEAHEGGVFTETITDYEGKPIHRQSISASMLYGNSTGVTPEQAHRLLNNIGS